MDLALGSKKNKILKNQMQMKSNISKRVFLALVVGPPFIIYLAIELYPNLLSVWYSFLSWNGFGKKVFIGLDNYKKLITDPFLYNALWHNVILMITYPFITAIVSLLLADILVNKKCFGGKFYKIIYFFPNILSSVVIALLWSFVYDGSFGLLNGVLKAIGIDIGMFYWLGDERTALLSLIPTYVWSGVGFYVIIFMNSMSAIPKSFYEYAQLEGASSRTKLFKITIPLIMPVIKVSILFMVLSALRGFETVLILTNGGPAGATDVIGLYMFTMAFQSGFNKGETIRNYGYASTIGMFLFVILIVAKLLIDKFFSSEAVEF